MSINISEQFRCVFIHTPRAAGTSIKEVLGLQGRGHLPWQYYCLVYPQEWNSFTKFTVVRNPWDRVVSSYTYARMKKSHWHDNVNQVNLHPDYAFLHDKTFSECCQVLKQRKNLLKHESWRPQYQWMAKQDNGTYRVMVDYVLRFENLENDFTELCERLGIRNLHLDRINKSDREQYRRYYSPETREIIADVYSKDIEMFNYDF